MSQESFYAANEADMLALGASFAAKLSLGDLVLLSGDLGAGKTTFVRGLLSALGVDPEEVRSPTFSLIQPYETDPPVLHADLYRVTNTRGIGLEDYFDSHLCLIEWPDRGEWAPPVYRINITWEGEGRRVELRTE